MSVVVVLRALSDEAYRALEAAHPDWREVPYGDHMVEVRFGSGEDALALVTQHDQAAGGDVVTVGVYEEPG
jgi:hypothetical protein